MMSFANVFLAAIGLLLFGACTKSLRDLTHGKFRDVPFGSGSLRGADAPGNVKYVPGYGKVDKYAGWPKECSTADFT